MPSKPVDHDTPVEVELEAVGLLDQQGIPADQHDAVVREVALEWADARLRSEDTSLAVRERRRAHRKAEKLELLAHNLRTTRATVPAQELDAVMRSAGSCIVRDEAGRVHVTTRLSLPTWSARVLRSTVGPTIARRQGARTRARSSLGGGRPRARKVASRSAGGGDSDPDEPEPGEPARRRSLDLAASVAPHGVTTPAHDRSRPLRPRYCRGEEGP